ncbi:MAG TPA: hypothetical protein EYP56_08060 [Planctomycetaceae bacterium]|nr:hypothetical protein [Planctomycetaceae bacterium]HIQ20907.1 hypothetical protein [Planctomycetota bacterium]
MFVWIFHRISGLLLILLMTFQLVTGFYQASASGDPLVQTMADLHRHALLNCLMVFLFVFHALYGIRTILMDLGMKHERLLFWCCNAVGLIIYAVFLVLYVQLV